MSREQATPTLIRIVLAWDKNTQSYFVASRESVPAPPYDMPVKCLVCGTVKPWGIWSPLGVAVCVECREKAFR